MTGTPAESTDTSLSIVVPAYHEREGICATLEALKSVMQQSGMVYEIIVVDDGSQDGTAAAAEQCEGVEVLRHNVNRGYGAALKTGIRRAQYALICITDADNTYPCERIPDLVTHLNSHGCDMVVGARTGKNVAIPLVRRPAKWAIGKLANVVAGDSIPDINSGLRVFKRSVAFRFFNLLPDGFSFTITITLGMLTNGYLVDYVPIDYLPRVGRSKIRPIRDTLNFVQLILRIALYFAPLKIFLPISVILMLLAAAWGAFSALALGQLADVSTMVIVMTGVQVATIGLLAELVNRRLPDYSENENPPNPRGRQS